MVFTRQCISMTKYNYENSVDSLMILNLLYNLYDDFIFFFFI